MQQFHTAYLQWHQSYTLNEPTWFRLVLNEFPLTDSLMLDLAVDVCVCAPTLNLWLQCPSTVFKRTLFLHFYPPDIPPPVSNVWGGCGGYRRIFTLWNSRRRLHLPTPFSHPVGSNGVAVWVALALFCLSLFLSVYLSWSTSLCLLGDA